MAASKKGPKYNDRLATNSGLIYVALKELKRATTFEISDALYSSRGFRLSKGRVADYLRALRDLGYVRRVALEAGRLGIWATTRKAAPGDWAEVFPPSISGCAGKGTGKLPIERDRDAPIGEGTCELAIMLGLVAKPQPPLYVGRVHALPREYDEDAELRMRTSA